MARCAFARFRPLKENETEPFRDMDQFIIHTQVGYFKGLYGYFNRDDIYAESHFATSMSGLLEQYIDTEREADANYRAKTAISVENEDKGDPIRNPFTDAQIELNIRLGRWAIETHGIPKRICPNPTAPGFGWHSMFGAPSHWTNVKGKTCPGATRIHQIKTEIFPEIFKDKDALVIPIAIVVTDVNGLDAGAGQVLRSRISTLTGFDVPVVAYNDDVADIAHAVIVGATRGMDLKKFQSYTIFSGEGRKETGQLIDALLGG